MVDDDVERLRFRERKIARRAGAPLGGGDDLEFERHRGLPLFRGVAVYLL
jgi:hypothetical protein